MKAETALALALRLKQYARRDRSRGFVERAADLRLASFYCQRFAATLIADEAILAKGAADEVRLACEAARTWREARHD
jgi:hypothetical protein